MQMLKLLFSFIALALSTSASAVTISVEFDFGLDESIWVTFDSSVERAIAGPPADDRVYFGIPINPGSSAISVEVIRNSPYTHLLPLGVESLGFTGTEIQNGKGYVRLDSDGDFIIGDRQYETSGNYIWEYSFGIFTNNGIPVTDVLNFNDTDLIGQLNLMQQTGTEFTFLESSGTRLSDDPLNWLEREQYILSGTIASLAIVPIPSAVWLFCSGLVGLIGLARNKA